LLMGLPNSNPSSRMTISLARFTSAARETHDPINDANTRHSFFITLRSDFMSHMLPNVTQHLCFEEVWPKLASSRILLVFIVLHALPLTRTGKVDRSALPPPASHRPELDIPFVASSTAGAKCWRRSGTTSPICERAATPFLRGNRWISLVPSAGVGAGLP
jgi:hypothetical protein